jgi:hypothetical protein
MSGLSKDNKISFSQDSRSPNKGSKPGRPEYEAGVLTSRAQSRDVWTSTSHVEQVISGSSAELC